MDQINHCEICGSIDGGRKQDFYYGQYLGATDVIRGGPGSINTWKEHYRILGRSSATICQNCAFREFLHQWKEWFIYDSNTLVIGLVSFFLGLYLSGLIFHDLTFWFLPIAFLCFVPLIFLMNLLFDFYLGDFHTNLAFKTKTKDLPRNQNLVVISTTKYQIMQNQAKARIKR